MFSFLRSVPSSALPILPLLPSQPASLLLLLPSLLPSWPSLLPSLPSPLPSLRSPLPSWPFCSLFCLLALLLQLVNNNLALFRWRLHHRRFLLCFCLVWFVENTHVTQHRIGHPGYPSDSHVIRFVPDLSGRM